MAYLTPEELGSHINEEIQTEISRGEDSKMEEAIKAAIEEVYSYLSKFDREAIFMAEGDERNPIILLYVKDCAVWHFIQLANPNIDLAIRERRYELAKTSLRDIQKGIAVPNLPYPAQAEPPAQNGQVRYGDRRAINRGFL